MNTTINKTVFRPGRLIADQGNWLFLDLLWISLALLDSPQPGFIVRAKNSYFGLVQIIGYCLCFIKATNENYIVFLTNLIGKG